MSHASTSRMFVIGDVHGCAGELEELIDKLPLTPDAVVIFVGDYIDRGPQSRRVIDVILQLSRLCRVVALKGNHESMLMDFLEAPDSQGAALFIYNGGSATLASYADERGHYALPDEHVAFFRNLKLWHEEDGYFFVHAGVPDVPLEELDPTKHGREMLWIRNPFLRSSFRWSKVIVHGHTPVPHAQVLERRINVDSGCVFDGQLSAVALPERRVYSVPRRAEHGHVYLRDRTSNRIAIRFKGAVPVRVIRDSASLPFETVDYNEFGMLIRDLSGRDDALLQQGERVKGEIGADPSRVVTWKGTVLRQQRDVRGVCYAIKLDAPPYKGP